jgi:hypothetical protein
MALVHGPGSCLSAESGITIYPGLGTRPGSPAASPDGGGADKPGRIRGSKHPRPSRVDFARRDYRRVSPPTARRCSTEAAAWPRDVPLGVLQSRRGWSLAIGARC